MSRLVDRFGPLLDEIGAGAVERELTRELPFEAVERLRGAGFGAVRLPVDDGGAGATFTELVDLLVELGRADANLPQLFRGHVAFVEHVLAPPPAGVAPSLRSAWVRRIAGGALVGNAQSERGGPLWRSATTVEPDPDPLADGWRVTGEKYYTTGTLFADWVYLSGRHGEDHAVALVPADHPDVERRDDWDGFGQRLTGSGTTIFRGVPVPDEDVTVSTHEEVTRNSQTAVFQLILLATLAGIGRRAVDDVVEAVRGRSRGAFTATVALPREDPQVQQVVGELAGRSFAAVATVREAGRAVEVLQRCERAGVSRRGRVCRGGRCRVQRPGCRRGPRPRSDDRPVPGGRGVAHRADPGARPSLAQRSDRRVTQSGDPPRPDRRGAPPRRRPPG